MNLFDYLIIASYLTGLLAMGFIFRKQTDNQDYFLAGRKLGWKPLSLSIMATQLSAVSFISAPAFVGLREGGGLIWLSYELALPLAILLLLFLVLPTLYRSGVVTVYEYLQRRFGVSTRVLISIVFQISRSFATAIMIYAISIIIQSTFGLAFWQSVLLIGVFTLIYSLQGGMKSVVYGDALQMCLIVLGALICLGFGLYHIGGFDAFWHQVEPSRLIAINHSSNGFDGDSFGLLPMIFGGLVLYASYYGCDQSEVQRALSAQSLSDMKKMLVAASFLRFPITFIYCAAGLVIGTLALNTPEFIAQIPEKNPDWLMPIFIINYLPNGVLGLLIVAIMAAAMSSLSSAINSLSAVTVEDYSRITQQSLAPHRAVRAARYSGLFWGIVTLGLSFFAGDIAPTIIEAINKIGSLFYGPILATFILAIATQNITAKHINFGIVLGVMSNLYLSLYQPQIFWFWWNLTGMLTTFVGASLGYLVTQRKLFKLRKTFMRGPLAFLDVFVLLSWFFIILAICIGLGSVAQTSLF